MTSSAPPSPVAKALRAQQPETEGMLVVVMICFRRNQKTQGSDEAWQCIRHHAPHDIEPYVAIAVNETMAQAGHLPPRDFGMRRAEGFRDPSRRLTDDFELAHDGALMQVTRKKGALVEIGDEGQRILCGERHVEKKGRVAPVLAGLVRRHRRSLRLPK